MTDTATQSDRLLSAKDVVEQLHISKQWLYNEVQRERFPRFRLGRQVRFKQSDVDAYLAASYVQGRR